MPFVAALLAPVALLMPGAAQGDMMHDSSGLLPDIQAEQPVSGAELANLETEAVPSVQYQVRIQQRVIIRVAPTNPAVRQNLMAELPQREQSTQLVERKIGKCVDMKGIAGVQATSDNRLMLYMRDQKLIAANLEKACSARDFYSGFYVEPSKDGQLCIERDKLQSRTGAKCEISRIRQLVSEAR